MKVEKFVVNKKMFSLCNEFKNAKHFAETIS